MAYAEPTLIRAGTAVSHEWGDEASGFVQDEVLVSSALLHSIIFTLPVGGSFVHSRANPTIFGADVVYIVLGGRLLLADPEHGQLVVAASGDALFFRRDTWHDGFNRGEEPVRVLELFAPTPAAGASSAYARAQPYLEHARYGDDAIIGHWPEAATAAAEVRRIHLATGAQRSLRLEGDVLWSIIASTEHLHAASGELVRGGAGPRRQYGGDAILHLTSGSVLAVTDRGSSTVEHSLGPGDSLVVPRGYSLTLGGEVDTAASFILGVAPTYDEHGVPT